MSINSVTLLAAAEEQRDLVQEIYNCKLSIVFLSAEQRNDIIFRDVKFRENLVTFAPGLQTRIPANGNPARSSSKILFDLLGFKSGGFRREHHLDHPSRPGRVRSKVWHIDGHPFRCWWRCSAPCRQRLVGGYCKDCEDSIRESRRLLARPPLVRLMATSIRRYLNRMLV